jgi:hypothetical protein
MFDAKDIIGDATKRAVKLFLAHKAGDVIPWIEIEKTAGFDRESPHWVQFSKRFRRDFMRASGIEVWPVNGVGLKLQTAEEQVKNDKRIHRALRQTTRSIKALRALVGRKDATAQQREMAHRKIDQQKTTRRGVLYSCRLGSQLAKPTSAGLPRVK